MIWLKVGLLIGFVLFIITGFISLAMAGSGGEVEAKLSTRILSWSFPLSLVLLVLGVCL
jgi:hypothetical protein